MADRGTAGAAPELRPGDWPLGRGSPLGGAPGNPTPSAPSFGLCEGLSQGGEAGDEPAA